MLRHKNIDRLCCLVLALTLALTCLYLGAAASGVIQEERTMGYENKLFDQRQVHTIDIQMDDWNAFVQTATSEEYTACDLVIDGERYANVAIRGKGNTSLTSVQQYGNNRYSFKVEFDHYQSSSTYHGLDKLSLNNIIQDNTYMKDYLAYTLMGRMGVASPLCSFVSITVNGENWGLYLAVEGVEDSFLQRNYGKRHGELYKPDSMSFGGGRGNGMDFNMDNFMENFDASQLPSMPGDFRTQKGQGGRGGMDGMGSDDVKLKYTNDDPASYANIFNNAKTSISSGDQARLIAALKALGEGDPSAVHTDAVIRYLAVHNFLCNDDSYTGHMVHNYYLYEENGVLEMIPWDYNLAFGGFQSSSATSAVNSPIDSPVSQGDISDRPMVAWIFNSEETIAQYHAAYQSFVTDTFASGWFESEFDRVASMIAPYMENDPTAFCSYEAFQQGVDTLRSFYLKRAESVQGQLDGLIPSTTEGQRNTSTLVDAADLNLSAMGSMGKGGGFGGDRGGMQMPGGFGGRGGQRGGDTMQPGMNSTPPGGFGDMPDMGSFGSQPPSGEVPDIPDGSSMPNMGFGGSQLPSDTMPDLPVNGISGEHWLALGLCAAVLATALLLTSKFKTFR